MVILNNEQKEYIKKNCHHPKEVIYYIEKRCKDIKQTMSVQQMVEIAELMIEEQRFYPDDEQEQQENTGDE